MTFLAGNAQRAADVQRILAQALALQRQGHIADAERLYASVLVIAPDNADALHSMGDLKLARGEPGEALCLIGAGWPHARRRHGCCSTSVSRLTR